MKPGTRVRMSAFLKQKLWGNCSPNDHLDWRDDLECCMKCSGQHVEEFGNCIGVVEDYLTGPSGEKWPEVNVRWLPSGLRYGYLPEDLVKVK